MRELVIKQQVKRRKQSLLLKAAGYRPHTDDGYLMNQIKQKPVVKYKKHFKIKKIRLPEIRLPRIPFPGFASLFSRFALSRTRNPALRNGPGMSPAVIGALAALIMVFSILSLNWQDESFTVPSTGMFLPELPADPQHQVNLASYAGLYTQAEEEQTPQENPIPLDMIETFAWTNYRVRRGDSVSAIALRHSVSLDAVIAGNGITNARLLKEGDILRIPNMDGIPYTVKKGDSLDKISKNMGVPLEAILDANDIQSDSISAGTMLFIPGARMRKEDLKLAIGEAFIYPIRGRLTSAFGWRIDPVNKTTRRFHAALDLASAMGTPVKASMAGRVATVGFNSNFGKFIILSHGGGYQTLYAHLSQVHVKEGRRVEQGVKIGEVGSTGYSTGPHLHFAVYKNGRAVNPLEYLN